MKILTFPPSPGTYTIQKVHIFFFSYCCIIPLATHSNPLGEFVTLVIHSFTDTQIVCKHGGRTKLFLKLRCCQTAIKENSHINLGPCLKKNQSPPFAVQKTATHPLSNRSNRYSTGAPIAKIQGDTNFIFWRIWVLKSRVRVLSKGIRHAYVDQYMSFFVGKLLSSSFKWTCILWNTLADTNVFM